MKRTYVWVVEMWDYYLKTYTPTVICTLNRTQAREKLAEVRIDYGQGTKIRLRKYEKAEP